MKRHIVLITAFFISWPWLIYAGLAKRSEPLIVWKEHAPEPGLTKRFVSPIVWNKGAVDSDAPELISTKKRLKMQLETRQEQESIPGLVIHLGSLVLSYVVGDMTLNVMMQEFRTTLWEINGTINVKEILNQFPVVGTILSKLVEQIGNIASRFPIIGYYIQAILSGSGYTEIPGVKAG
ncbi:hypothetical protein JTB14_034668 [Gonioctena quinquepunctata]|nr:hypothetical protein JTB14_034668 [Gonioctena quinquepunctata]